MRTRRRLLAQTAALAAGAAGAWWLRREVAFPAPQAVFDPDAADGGWTAFLGGPQLVAVGAAVGGAAIGALVDSGAQTSVIDRAAAARLGVPAGALLPLLAYGVTGAPQVGHAAVADVALGGLSLPGLHLAVLDLQPIVQATGRLVELVIGQDVLRRAAVDIDFPRGRLAFHPSGARPSGVALSALPARLHGHELLAGVGVEGHALEAVVDTGSSSALALSERAARAAGLLDAGRTVRTEIGVTFGGAGSDRLVTVESLSLAGRRPLRGVAVQVFPTPSGLGQAPDALLGVGAFLRDRVLLDLARGEFWFVGGRSAAVSLAR